MNLFERILQVRFHRYDVDMSDTSNSHESALQITELRFSHGRSDGARFTLEMPHFTLAKAEEVLFVGASGSGKSTLLGLIAGLIQPDGGRILIGGEDITTLDGAARDRFRGRSIGMIFQTFNLLEGFTARENIELALLFSGTPPSEHRPRTDALLERLGIERPGAMPGELSIGQQQRVAVARALAPRPALVLADEPTASLDPENAQTAIDLIRESCKEDGAALLCTSHDPSLKDTFQRVEALS